jgi:GGDEF domain-containing protein
VGVAVIRDGNADASALLHEADQAMYAAKCRGKGMFQIAPVPAA